MSILKKAALPQSVILSAKHPLLVEQEAAAMAGSKKSYTLNIVEVDNGYTVTATMHGGNSRCTMVCTHDGDIIETIAACIAKLRLGT